MAPPRQRKDKPKPWCACVSERWIEQTGKVSTFKENHEALTVLALDLPDDMFGEDDQAWLADDEEDEE
jgi:hypothetical protein